jgi:hypothetical protein
VSQLTARQRQIFDLRNQGLTAVEVGRRLGDVPSTVNMTCARARELLAMRALPCSKCHEDPAGDDGLCGFCHEERRLLETQA